MTESQVIEENYGLACALARKFFRSGAPYDFDDLLQVALMSMVRVHRKYVPERGKFSTFATYCMRHDLMKFVTKQNKIKEREFPLVFEKYEVEDVNDVLPDNLTIHEQAIFYYKKNNYNNKEICEILDLSRESFKDLEKSCYTKIRNANT